MIKAHNLHYAHKTHTILKGIEVYFPYGKLISIVGPNGAGKSTLLNLLANELAYPKGSILFKDKLLETWNDETLAKHKAKFSQQQGQDIPIPSEEVVMMGRYPYFNYKASIEDKNAVQQSLKDFDLMHLAHKDYNLLSGGEKQRVHLARVMCQLHNKESNKLLFMDEPLNNLDIKHQHLLLRFIKKFTEKQNTAVLVMHDLNLTAEFSDYIYLLKDGEITAEGSPEEVFKSSIISEAYQFPCSIHRNPITNSPMVIFGQ